MRLPVISNDVSTTDVVWAAAQRISKTENEVEINRICDYLISKNWFHTAGDLRVARANDSEWHALAIPGRLKLALQEILDGYTPTTNGRSPTNTAAAASVGTSVEAAPVRDSDVVYQEPLPNTNDSAYPTGYWGSDKYDYSQSTGGEADTLEYADSSAYQRYYDQSAYYSETEATAEEGGGERCADDVVADTSYEGDPEAHAAAWAAYYAANGITSVDGTWNGEWANHTEPFLGQEIGNDGSAEVEIAGEGEVSSAQGQGLTEWEEGGDSTEHIDIDVAPASTISPALPIPTKWTCGQCTYVNAMDEAFCEMCFGHISLSPDKDAADGSVMPASMAISTAASPERARLTRVAITAESPLPLTLKQASARNTPGEPPTPSTTATSVLVQPRYVCIPQPSPPLPANFSPSAPAFEDEMDSVSGFTMDPLSLARSPPPPPPPLPAAAAPLAMTFRQALQAFQQEPVPSLGPSAVVLASKDDQLLPPTHTTQDDHFLALAFKKIPTEGTPASGPKSASPLRRRRSMSTLFGFRKHSQNSSLPTVSPK